MKKNYIKLIGSIICAFSMVMTVALVAIGAQANDKTIEYVENVKYEQDNTAPTAPAGYSRDDGYLFAGWYVEDVDSTTGYSPVEEPEVGQSYFAKYVPSEVLGVKAQVSGQIVDNDTDKITNDKVNNAIRFVTSLDSTEYNHIGFNIKIDGTSYNQDAATTKSVYKTVYGIGADKNTVMEKYYPYDEFHKQSQYFKTYTFTTIPESAFDSDITVTPYWITLDGTRVDGPETAVKTVNYGRAWYYVDVNGEVTNKKAPVGTYSNPYTTLDEAIKVEPVKLYPRLILKSDIEVDETINVAKTITIAGFESAKTITYNNEKNSIFDVTENGNLTLDTLNLNGGNYVVKSTNATVTANKVEIKDGGYYGFQIIGGTAELNDVKIAGVTRGVRLESEATVTGETLNITGPIQQGISCGGGSTFDYKDLDISGNTDCAINVFGNSTAIVNGGEITNAKGNGLNVAGAKTATLIEVKITYAADATENYGIYVYPDSNVIPDVTLEDVDITGAGKAGVALRNGATGSYTGGTVRGSKGKGIYLYDSEKGTNGASITLEGVNIENSTEENLYVDNGSTATVNGTLNMKGGNSHSLAVNGGSKVKDGTNASKITIDTPKYNGVRIEKSGSLLEVGNMELKNCQQHGIYIKEAGQAKFNGSVSIQGASSGNVDCLYVTGESSQATINGTLTTEGGRHGLAIYDKSTVTKGVQGGNVTINSPRENGVRIYGVGCSLDIDVLNVNNSKAHALEVSQGKATINGGLLTVSSSASGEIFAVKAISSADVTLNNVEIKNPIYHGMAVWTKASVKGSNLTISQANGHGIHCGDSGSSFNISNLTISGSNERAVNLFSGASATINGGMFTSPKVGAYLENNSTLTITGTLTVNTPSDRGIQNVGGTVNAGNATVIVNSPTTFGISTNVYKSDSATIPGTTTIGVLNVSGAKGFSSVTVNGTGSVVTINGGKIENSKGHGVSAEYGTLNLNNVEITGSGTNKCDVWAQKGSTINLTSMINADSLIKGYQSYDESEGATQGIINVK